MYVVFFDRVILREKKTFLQYICYLSITARGHEGVWCVKREGNIINCLKTKKTCPLKLLEVPKVDQMLIKKAAKNILN